MFIEQKVTVIYTLDKLIRFFFFAGEIGGPPHPVKNQPITLSDSRPPLMNWS